MSLSFINIEIAIHRRCNLSICPPLLLRGRESDWGSNSSLAPSRLFLLLTLVAEGATMATKTAITLCL